MVGYDFIVYVIFVVCWWCQYGLVVGFGWQQYVQCVDWFQFLQIVYVVIVDWCLQVVFVYVDGGVEWDEFICGVFEDDGYV